MALDDFVESEVAVAVAATAALASPRVRGLLRGGAIYGLAGLLLAGGTISPFARGVAQGAQQTASSAATRVREAAPQPQAAAEGAEPRRTRRTREATAEGEGGASR